MRDVFGEVAVDVGTGELARRIHRIQAFANEVKIMSAFAGSISDSGE